LGIIIGIQGRFNIQISISEIISYHINKKNYDVPIVEKALDKNSTPIYYKKNYQKCMNRGKLNEIKKALGKKF
jgi:hypothetical protein